MNSGVSEDILTGGTVEIEKQSLSKSKHKIHIIIVHHKSLNCTFSHCNHTKLFHSINIELQYIFILT